MCADVCIHDTGDGNPHAHILLTMRPINLDGTWGTRHRKEYILDGNGNKIYDPKKKTYKCRRVSSTDWDEQTKAEEWRKDWADSVNRSLKKYNIEKEIDHRSYVRQGKEQIPTIHLGSEAFQMEKRGIRTMRGDINRDIEVNNKKLRQLNARIKKVKSELYALPLLAAPSMIDIAKNVQDWNKLKTNRQKVKNLQDFVDNVDFLIENGINDMDELADKAESMCNESRNLSSEIKITDRRLDTLSLHLHHYSIWEKYKKLSKQYNELAPKNRDTFYAKHKTELDAYKKSIDYLKAHLNGRTTIPIKKWESEYKELTAKRYSLCDKYYDLRSEIKSVEQLKRGALNLIKAEEIERKPQRKRDFER